MARFAQAVVDGRRDSAAASSTRRSSTRSSAPAMSPISSDRSTLARALQLAPPRRPAAPPRRRAGGRSTSTSPTGTLTRPPGLQLDSGGLAKGLFADVLAETLASHTSFASTAPATCVLGGAGGGNARGQGAEPVRRRHAAHLRAVPYAASPRAGSAGAAGSTPAGGPPTTCSTPPPAGRRSPASCRSRRSRRAR